MTGTVLTTNAAPSTNIADHLPAMAGQDPHRAAVIFPHTRDRRGRVSYTHMTYRQLDEESDRLARGLIDLGVGAGVRAVLMVPPSLEFFALVFALFKARAVMVCVDPGIGIHFLGRCLGEARPTAFLGVGKAHLARRLFGWGKKTLRTRILVGRGAATWRGMISLDELRRRGERSHATLPTDTAADATAAVLFTSGSTGPPKGAVYTHGHFGAQVRALQATYGIEPGEVDLATFPLFGLFAPALGMTAVVPDMDFTRPGHVDPQKIIEPVENFGVTNLFGSPALLRRVAEWAAPRGVRLPSLRRVVSAGAPVPAEVLKQFSKLLSDGAPIFTPYGATESLPVASIDSHEILAETAALTAEGRGVCVGRPVGDIELRFIKITDDPIEQWSDTLPVEAGEIGEIVVRGPMVTREYFGRPEATRQAKIPDPRGGFFHRMGDVGYQDTRGRVWFCGRKSHRVGCADGDRFTIPTEAVLNRHPKVFRTALVSVVRGGVVEPVLCVELDKSVRRRERATIRRELKELAAEYSHTQGITAFLFHPGFPVDIRHNAKIGREKLARWAERRLR